MAMTNMGGILQAAPLAVPITRVTSLFRAVGQLILDKNAVECAKFLTVLVRTFVGNGDPLNSLIQHDLKSLLLSQLRASYVPY